MITAGSRLGPYEITATLGAGGMGEVYRARDSRLDRTVAIKVLPERFSSDPRLRERFEREARAISALSHPHICTLYDIGSENGTHFLVMEYLEGESLADRLAKGPLPVEQAIRYGVEIAEALEKAHRAGIVHRDLKPGNIVLTRSGAKLLDFGLAKFSQTPAQSDPNLPTIAMTAQKPLTEEGTVVGTFQYMAPEQIEGRDADPRTDIFALGVVLYEMATGRRAFDAKTRASLIASILDREPPPISTVQPLTPPAFERVVKMCLAKDPDERWQSAHDVAAELKWIASASSDTIGPGARARTRRAWLRNAALLAAGLIAGAAAVWLFAPGNAQPARVTRTTIRTPATAPVLLDLGTLAISPDGQHIVYRARSGGDSRFFVRAVDRFDAAPLNGTDNAHSPAFSPDGRWIAFFRNNTISKVPRDGGTPIRIADSAGGGLGLSWRGDKIYATRAFAGGVWEIPAQGGTPRRVAETSNEQRAVVWPDILPGGKTVLATVWSKGPWDNAKIVAFPVAGGKQKAVVDGGYNARYSETGHLLFMRGGNLMAVAFDPESLETRSDAVVVVSGVSHGEADGESQYAITPAGHLAYITGGDSMPQGRLMWIDRTGKQQPIVPARRRYGSVALTPDGRGALVTIESATFDVWHLDFERDTLTRVSHGGDDANAVMTPDGNRVIWNSSRTGQYHLHWRAADNSTPDEALTSGPEYHEAPAVTPDGKSVIYTRMGQSRKLALWQLPFDTRKPRPLIETEFNERDGVVSPDGRWLAWASDESGKFEVYVTSFPTPAGKWQISTNGGLAPRWMPDGRELVYLNGRELTIVPVETSPRVRAGKPRVLATGNFDDEYGIDPSGRIAIVLSEDRPTSDQINLVLNWSRELERRVPSR